MTRRDRVCDDGLAMRPGRHAARGAANDRADRVADSYAGYRAANQTRGRTVAVRKGDLR